MRPSNESLTQLYPDYWWVETTGSSYMVSTAMAQVVQEAVARRPQPSWVSVVDLGGARIALRTRTIVSVEQSSPASRAMWRRIRQEMKLEEELGR
jgi:hypothetical protein